MVSSVEDDSGWQETESMERDTQETVTRMVTTTREGTMETKESSKAQSSCDTIAGCNQLYCNLTVVPNHLNYRLTVTPKDTFLSQPTIYSNACFPHPSAPRASTSCIAVIPHPSDLLRPTSMPEGFYLVIVGQEVGIFYMWKDAALTFQRALADYTAAYNKGELHVIPKPGRPFWPTVLHMPSPVLSEGEQSYWAEVDDLTDVLSQVQLDPAGSW
ncbi:hypothetical protein EDD15DRAFT_2370618 [Pisolithus albus]|nr:hypothetical protein EDD15DRAFT_2370618 [Pisolithus albus]